jgi:hypothetical protein
MTHEAAPAWRWRELLGLLVLGAAILLLWRVPWLGWLVYPFRVFGTFVHELSHGLAAVLTGGDFQRFTVSADLSGLAWSAGGIRWIVASAGYVGSAVFGGLLVLLAERGVSSRTLLVAMGIGLALLSLLFVRNLFGIVAGLSLGVALALAGRVLRAHWADLLLLSLALQSMLDGFNSLLNVLTLSTRDDVRTDAHTMAELSGLPAMFWVVAWSLLSAAIVYASLRLAYRRPAPARVTSDTPS